jgi:hypothetical protein
MADLLTITAVAIKDASNAPIATGTFSIQATDAQNNPIPFGIGGGGQSTTKPVVKTITAGAISGLSIANPALTSPINILFKIVIQDTSVSPTASTTYHKVQIVDDGSGNWDFDTMNTGLLLPAIPLTIVPGPAGPPGIGSGSQFAAVPTGAIDGSNLAFTLSHTPILLWLYKNGVFQTPGVDYSLATATITYTIAPLSGDAHYAQGIY